MTDRERAIAALERAGFVQAPGDPNLYISPTGSAILHDRINGVELWETQARIADLLSPLTLEMVEKAADEVWSEFKAREDLSVEARDAGIVALERLEALLRQQMGGGQG